MGWTPTIVFSCLFFQNFDDDANPSAADTVHFLQ
jgi:hypothetical protein